MTPAITTILSRWIEPPREISQDATLADLGMTCGGILESIKCDLEEQVLGREFRDPAAIYRDMTVADLVALVLGERGV